MSVMLHPRRKVFYYSTGVFLASGIAKDVVQYANIGTGAINVLMTGISVCYYSNLCSVW